MSTGKLNPIASKHLNRGDTTFKVLNDEVAAASEEAAEEQQTKKEIKNKTRKSRESLTSADELRKRIIEKRVEHGYREGSRKKSPGERGSRSRSNGSIVVAEEPSETPIKEVIHTKPQGSFLPQLNSSSTNKPSSTVSSLFSGRKKGVPLLRLGGKKTKKRRRTKKSCGWFW